MLISEVLKNSCLNSIILPIAVRSPKASTARKNLKALSKNIKYWSTLVPSVPKPWPFENMNYSKTNTTHISLTSWRFESSWSPGPWGFHAQCALAFFTCFMFLVSMDLFHVDHSQGPFSLWSGSFVQTISLLLLYLGLLPSRVLFSPLAWPSHLLFLHFYTHCSFGWLDPQGSFRPQTNSIGLYP